MKTLIDFYKKVFEELKLQPVYAFQFDDEGYPIESSEEESGNEDGDDAFVDEEESEEEFISEEPSPEMEL